MVISRKVRQALILKNGIECEKFTFSDEIRNQVREELNLDHDTLSLVMSVGFLIIKIIFSNRYF